MLNDPTIQSGISDAPVASIRRPFCPHCRSRLPAPKKVEIVVCINCRQSVERTRPWTKFCSPLCRTEYHDALTNPRFNQLRTTSEMAAILGVSVSTVRNRVRRGELRSRRVGRLLLIHESTVDPQVVTAAVPAEVAHGLREFVSRYYLSVRTFANMCGLRPTTAHRLLAGALLAHRFDARKTALRERIKRFLVGQNKTDEEIQIEIESIFKDR